MPALKAKIIFLFFLLAPTVLFADAVKLLDRICESQGLHQLHEKSSLRFTFNVILPGREISRTWFWDIQNNTVTLDGKPEDPKGQKFVNDTYWLFFPLVARHSAHQTKLTMKEKVPSPLAGVPTTELTVAYQGEHGHTPGDAYVLYIDDKLRIIEWSFLKGGQQPPRRTNHWKDYRDMGGVTFSLDRPADDGFRL